MGSQRSSANPGAVGAPAGNSDPELAALIQEMGEELGVVAEPAGSGAWHAVEGHPLWTRSMPQEPELIQSSDVLPVEPAPSQPPQRPWSDRDEKAVTQVDPDRGHDPRSRHWVVRER